MKECTIRDLDRFNFYAPRVRSLAIHCSHVVLPLPLYEALYHLNGDVPLLPRLRTLEWNASEWIGITASISLLQVYATPGLASLSLRNADWRADGLLLGLSSLPSRFPSLQLLHLDLNNVPQDISPVLSIVREWQRIRILNFSLRALPLNVSAGPQLLPQLASVQKLQKLSLYADVLPTRGTLPITSHTHATFHALTTLIIHSNDPPVLLYNCHFPSLRQFEVRTHAVVIPRIPSMLRSHIPCNRLMVLIFRTTFISRRKQTSRLVMRFEDMCPLMELHNLRHLIIQLRPTPNESRWPHHVQLQIGIELTDDEWETLVRAWPRLLTLDVAASHAVETADGFGGPSYRVFASLIRHCPFLEEIGLFIAHSSGTEDDLVDLPSSRRQVKLKLYHSRIDPKDYRFTATWIRHMFPRVASISRWTSRTVSVGVGIQGKYEAETYESGWVEMMQWVAESSPAVTRKQAY